MWCSAGAQAPGASALAHHRPVLCSLRPQVFSLFDRSGNGTVAVKDLNQLCNRVGMSIPQSKLAAMVSCVDRDGSGNVNWAEFVSFFFAVAKSDQEYTPLSAARYLLSLWAEHATGMEAEDLGSDLAASFDLAAAGEVPRPAVVCTAGACAGAVSRTMTAPFDRIKTLMQAADGTAEGQRRITGIRSALKHVMSTTGWAGLWRGNGVNVIKTAPETAVRFMVFENLKQYAGDEPGLRGILARFAAGASAGALAQITVYPLEIVKTRIAVSTYDQYSGIVHCATSTVQREGWRALYRGLSASLMGMVPYAGVDLTVYSMLREHLAARRAQAAIASGSAASASNSTPPVTEMLLCGATSSACGQVVSYPLQLVRTRLQAQGMKGRPEAYTGVWDCLVKTFQADGFRGLYQGLTPNLLKGLPAISISYAVYETVKSSLN